MAALLRALRRQWAALGDGPASGRSGSAYCKPPRSLKDREPLKQKGNAHTEILDLWGWNTEAKHPCDTNPSVPTSAMLLDASSSSEARKRLSLELPIERLARVDNMEFMAALPSASMQLIVTSPPYNIGKAYERKRSLEQYLASQSLVIDECVRLLNSRGSICWQVGNHVDNGEIFPLDTMLYPIFRKHGLKLRNRIVWHFEHGLHCSKRLSGRYETIMWFTKTDDYIFNLDSIRVPSKYPGKKHFKGPKAGQLSGNPLGKNPGDVWILPNVKNNHVEKTIHPCQFPVELVERLVLALTGAGGRVFDPYMGVGSAPIAAEMHGREGYGCDIVREYVDIAQARMNALRDRTLRTRPMHRPVYDPTKPRGGH